MDADLNFRAAKAPDRALRNNDARSQNAHLAGALLQSVRPD
jgi:hypothetical protein